MYMKNFKILFFDAEPIRKNHRMSKIIEKFEKFNEIKIFVFRWKGIPSYSIYKNGPYRKKLDAFYYRLK
jgi:hypothetical protein